ncbi:Hsp70 family protein [Phaeobacter sp.]|uniref:Hsp70 family protein n=1 Tax=Phaeobacter sp. TaxID=1902409 RepID=UPI0025FB151B|nr:Hsp70 family protein [Phaeobacter sp.]
MVAHATLGIDFGTSNSAAGVSVNGRPWLIDLEPSEQTVPTAVFFDADSRRMKIGRPATRALINGDEGRFMRALKSLLGTSLLREKRRLNGELIDFTVIIARFLKELKTRAERATGQEYTRALSGRPVRFHSSDDQRDAQAETDLRECYLQAGFEDVQFMFEPEAALRATSVSAGFGVIVDIGGGTSDFTVFEQPVAPQYQDRAPRILASAGVRVGGTDFDRQLSIQHVMPLLGMGTDIKSVFGDTRLPAPNRMFQDLATWQMIPFTYSAECRRAAQDLYANAVEPKKLARLVSVLSDELGHDLAFAVERGKIRTNQAIADGPDADGQGAIDLRVLEPGLSVALAHAAMADSLDHDLAKITACLEDLIRDAGVGAGDLDHVVLVGGSALMQPLQDQLRQMFPGAQFHCDNAMTAVADGLALAAGDLHP